MKKKRPPPDLDATRVNDDATREAAVDLSAGPSRTEIFSQAVREAEATGVDRTTVDAMAGDRAAVLDVPKPAPARRTFRGAFAWLAAGVLLGAAVLAILGSQ